MKKIFTTLLIAAGLIAVPSVAHAGGSDAPTPYTVTVDGVYLPAGDVFSANEHVNVRDDTGKSYSIHFEEKYADPNNQEWKNRPFDHTDPRNQFYGGSFLPWEALNGFNAKSDFCVTWVQVSGYNEHFGEGGQDPIGPGCENPNPPMTEYSEWTHVAFDCTTEAGDVINRSREVTVTTYFFNGEVKDVTTTTQTEQYTVTEMDVLNIECREVVNPVAPALKLATVTCTDQDSTYTPAVMTLPAVENGVWKIGDETVSGDFTLARDQVVSVTFTVSDGDTYRVGDAPTPEDGSFWTAEKDGNSIVYTVTSNAVEDIADCDLANSGLGMSPWIIAGAIVLPVAGVALAFSGRKKARA